MFILFFVSGCATQQKFLVNKRVGQWESKVQISDFSEKKTYSLNMNVVAEKPDLFRAEISGTLGVSVASVLLNKEQLSYAIHRTKKFYFGTTSDQALKPVLRVHLNPKYLVNIFFDEAIEEPGWKCQKNQNHFVESCFRETDNFSILWSERNGENKRVFIKNDKFEMQIVVKSFQTKVQNREKAFELSAPNNYKSYKLIE